MERFFAIVSEGSALEGLSGTSSFAGGPARGNEACTVTRGYWGLNCIGSRWPQPSMWGVAARRLHAGQPRQGGAPEPDKSGRPHGHYPPTMALGAKDRLQAFTAIGAVKEGEPDRATWRTGSSPDRRDVRTPPGRQAPILRYSTRWSSPPGSRIGVIRCARTLSDQRGGFPLDRRGDGAARLSRADEWSGKRHAGSQHARRTSPRRAGRGRIA